MTTPSAPAALAPPCRRDLDGRLAQLLFHRSVRADPPWDAEDEVARDEWLGSLAKEVVHVRNLERRDLEHVVRRRPPPQDAQARRAGMNDGLARQVIGQRAPWRHRRSETPATLPGVAFASSL